jgi:fibronectin type 3 domain-containing protein
VPVSGTEAVTLVWDAVTAADLAGYIVLRVTGNSETVEELTPKPITQTQFPDTTTRAGQRYDYYVVAVDTAGNRGPRSNVATVNRLPSTGK